MSARDHHQRNQRIQARELKLFKWRKIYVEKYPPPFPMEEMRNCNEQQFYQMETYIREREHWLSNAIPATDLPPFVHKLVPVTPADWEEFKEEMKYREERRKMREERNKARLSQSASAVEGLPSDPTAVPGAVLVEVGPQGKLGIEDLPSVTDQPTDVSGGKSGMEDLSSVTDQPTDEGLASDPSDVPDAVLVEVGPQEKLGMENLPSVTDQPTDVSGGKSEMGDLPFVTDQPTGVSGGKSRMEDLSSVTDQPTDEDLPSDPADVIGAVLVEVGPQGKLGMEDLPSVTDQPVDSSKHPIRHAYKRDRSGARLSGSGSNH